MMLWQLRYLMEIVRHDHNVTDAARALNRSGLSVILTANTTQSIGTYNQWKI